MISDPFKVLGVRDDCSDADLKKAYREKSKKWHPDQNPGKEEYAEKRFQEVQEAYRQIQDARQRGTSAVPAESVSAGTVSAESVSTGTVSAGTVSAESVSTGTVSAGTVPAESISAGRLSEPTRLCGLWNIQ